MTDGLQGIGSPPTGASLSNEISGVGSQVPSANRGDENTQEISNVQSTNKQESIEARPQVTEEELELASGELAQAVAEAHEKNFFALDYLAMKKKYPLAIAYCVQYFKNKASGRRFDEADAIGSFLFAARLLYDFLDSQNIPLSVYREDGKWAYSITDGEIISPINSRVEAEIEGFDYAFYTFNELLKER